MDASLWRRVSPDPVIAAAAILVGVAITWRGWSGGALGPVLVIAAGTAMWAVRRAPGRTLLAEAALGLYAGFVEPVAGNVPQFYALIALGVLAARASAALTGAAYLAVCAVTVARVAGQDAAVLTWWRLLLLLVVLAAPVTVGRYIGGVRAERELRRERAAEREELRRAEERAARLAERTRIARELHDSVAHHVGAMVLRANAARYAGPAPEVAEALADIRRSGTEVLEDLRGLLAALRDPDAAGAEPVGTLEEAVDRAVASASAAGLAVRTTLDPAAAEVSAAAQTLAAHVVREGLTNVLKHAGTTATASVEATVDDGRLRVEVRNGAPTGPPTSLPSTGYGLTGLRERFAAVGGTVEAGPADGGWRLSAAVPLEAS